MSNENYLHSELTEKIISGFYHVYNKLGYGFSERVYENALSNTLRKNGVKIVQQTPIIVYFEGEVVGDYLADIIADDVVIVELKAVEELHSKHEAQLLNYLKATSIEVGLLLNFGVKPEIRRKVLSNDRK
jgi:GxxExxY protein